MSNNGKLNFKETYGDSYELMFDDPLERNVMTIKIPLKKVAEHTDQFGAMCFMQGFFDTAKDQAIAITQIHKIRKRKQGLIAPQVVM